MVITKVKCKITSHRIVYLPDALSRRNAGIPGIPFGPGMPGLPSIPVEPFCPFIPENVEGVS